MKRFDVAIVDYGLGNIFSIQHACAHVGLEVCVTSNVAILKEAKSIILPGVGAFGDAMSALTSLGLVDSLKRIASSGVPFLGICLGQQLLFERSEEFGDHEGLGLLPGVVRYLPVQECKGRRLKVPQVGWNAIHEPAGQSGKWNDSLLASTAAESKMYFVHSCYADPKEKATILAETVYGNVRFCSACKTDNIMSFQFHPERSGKEGLKIYAEFAKLINKIDG